MTSISKTKLPVLRPSLTERPELYEKLKSTLFHKLTLVAAPAGYGKTVLVSQFAHQVNCAVVWHTLEEKERDFPNLLVHCVEVCSELLPNLQLDPLDVMITPLEAAQYFADTFRNSSFDDLLYVFDDIHHLIDSPAAEKWLRALIEALPPKCHVILVGRALPKLPFLEMVAHGDILAVGQEALRFTFMELQNLAQLWDLTASKADLQNILTQFDGWPAGCILALQPFPAEIEPSIFLERRGPEALFDFLAEVMLHTQSELLQDFLLASSTLASMTPASCQNVLGLPDSRTYLSEVIRKNLFASELPGSVVYHALFRRFLQQHLKAHDPDRFRALHIRAGRWFEDNNRLEEAFEHYARAEQWKLAAAIAERAASAFMSKGKHETILYWREQLRQTSVDYPQLLYLCATLYKERYQFAAAQEALTEAEEIFQKYQDEVGRLKIRLLQASIENLQGEYHHALTLAEAVLQENTVQENIRGLAFYILGTAHLHLGHHREALQHLENALPLYRATGDGTALSELLLTLEFAFMRVGQFNRASAFLQEAIDIRRSLGNRRGLIRPLNNLGYDYHLLGNYAQAVKTFQEGIEVATQVSEKRGEGYLLWSMADILRDMGHAEEALSFYLKALNSTASNEPSLRCLALSGLATQQRWQGQVEESWLSVKEAVLLAEKHALSFELLKAQMSFWSLHMQQGKVGEAREALENIAKQFQEQRAETEWGQCLALCAFAALLQDDAPGASRYFKSVVEAVTHEANLQPCAAEIVHTPLLKTFMQSRSARYPTLQTAVKRLEAVLIEKPINAISRKKSEDDRTYSLRVCLFGGEQVERDGVVVPLSAWRAANARELFFYLLLKGPTSRELLSLVLWPESSPKQAAWKFHSTLHRARHAVGTDALLFEDDLYLLNPGLDVWCDVLEYEALIDEARLSSPLRPHTENLWWRAVSLYQGDFLLGADAIWVDQEREALAEMYLEALIALGTCIRTRGNIHEAIATYQRAIAIDPYREDIHRAILACYAALGERSAIQRQLEKLTQLLDADLGVRPSPETLALARSFLS